MNKRQIGTFLLKACIAAGIFGLILSRMDVSRVWDCLRTAQLRPILIAILLMFATVFMAGWRWRRLLEAYGVQIPLHALIFTSHIGQLFTLFLPGPIGDDLVRMLYISKLAKGRVGHALTSVLMDRISGLLAILILAVVCIPNHWSILLAGTTQTRWLAMGMVSVAGGVCFAGMTLSFFNTSQIQKGLLYIFSFLPKTKHTRSVVTLAAAVSDNRKTLSIVMMAAVVTQLLVCGAFYYAGNAVGISLPFTVWLGFVPIILAANAVPITIAGIGVRDYLVVLFLGVLGGIDQTQALAASLILFSVSLVFCLSGGITYLLYKPKEDVVPAPIQAAA